MTADLILAGGRVYTVDRARPVAEAVAVSGGRIVAVGDDADVLEHAEALRRACSSSADAPCYRASRTRTSTSPTGA